VLLSGASVLLTLGEDVVEDWVEWDEAELAALPGQLELGVLEIDLGPGERGEFSEPQSGEREQVEGALVAFGPNRGVDIAELLVGVGDGLEVGKPGQLDISGRVARDELVADAVAVGGPQIGEMPLDRRDRTALE
jgi:hypothetical protein